MNKYLKKLYLFATLKVLYPFWYARFCKSPLKEKKVVFVEANLSSLSNSLQVLYQELEKSGEYQLHIHCLEEIQRGKFAYIKKVLHCLKNMGDAKYVFLCEGSRPISCIRPRKDTVITQLWHGCGAFKKFGFSTADGLFGGDFKEYLQYSYYKNYDYVTVSSPEVIWAYEEAMNISSDSEIIQPLGISRTDVFFREEFTRQAYEHLYQKIPFARGKKVILYAPTFRGSVGKAISPDALDIAYLGERLQKEYVLLIKHHPIVKQRPVIDEKWRDCFAFDVSEELEIEELLCVSDICISDYSSLVFEYSLFERPMLFFAYDLEEYGDWRGFYYEYKEMTPGPVFYKTEDLMEYILQIEDGFDKHKVQEFKKRFMSSCDGCATKRILDTVMNR